MLAADAKTRLELPGLPSPAKGPLCPRPSARQGPELPSQYIAMSLGYLRLPAELVNARQHSLAKASGSSWLRTSAPKQPTGNSNSSSRDCGTRLFVKPEHSRLNAIEKPPAKPKGSAPEHLNSSRPDNYPPK